MDTDAIKGVTRKAQVFAAKPQSPQSGFAEVLSEQEEKEKSASETDQVLSKPASGTGQTPSNPQRVLLGTITESMPTVSHLLVGHPEYGKECWSIIHSEHNRQKPYTQIPSDTAIFIDPETQKIEWGEPEGEPGPSVLRIQEVRADQDNLLEQKEIA